MTKELERLRDNLCTEWQHAHEGYVRTDFNAGFNALHSHLTAAAGEFDEKAAQAEADSAMENLGPTMFTRDECAAEMVSHARWQFEQNRARIGRAEIEIDHLKTSLQIGKDFAEINANRMKAAEARLAECARKFNHVADQRIELQDKLTAAKAACDSNAQLALKLRERVRELSEFIKEKGLR